MREQLPPGSAADQHTGVTPCPGQMRFCFCLVGEKAPSLLPPLPRQAGWELDQCCPGVSPCPRWLWAAQAWRGWQPHPAWHLPLCPAPCGHGPWSSSPFSSEGSGLSPRSQGCQQNPFPPLCSSLGAGDDGRDFLSQLAVAEPVPRFLCPMVPPPHVTPWGCGHLPAHQPVPGCYSWWGSLVMSWGVVQHPCSKLWVCSCGVASPTSGSALRAKLETGTRAAQGTFLHWLVSVSPPPRRADGFSQGPSAPLPLGFVAARAPQALSPLPGERCSLTFSTRHKAAPHFFPGLFLPPRPLPGARLRAGSQGPRYGCSGRGREVLGAGGSAGQGLLGMLFPRSHGGSVSFM